MEKTGKGIFEAKQKLRKEMLARRNSLLAAEKEQLDKAIVGNLLKSPLWQKAGRIFLYVSLPEEADSRPLLEAAWKDGKPLALPRIESASDARMDFYYCGSAQGLVAGPFSIPEPAPDQIALEEPDLVILPGLAFDYKGGRLGYGKAFYDNYLSKKNWKQALLLGLAYDFQIRPSVPCGKTDVPVNGVCTSSGIKLWQAV